MDHDTRRLDAPPRRGCPKCGGAQVWGYTGTTFAAHWLRDSVLVETTPLLTADQDYAATWIAFQLQPNGQPLPAGVWSVQLFQNGEPGPQTRFTVTDGP